MNNAEQPLTLDEAERQIEEFEEVFGSPDGEWWPMPEVAPGFFQVVTDAVTISVHADVALEYRIHKG